MLEGLLSFLEEETWSFHVPGHKGGRAALAALKEAFGPALFRFDLTELPSTDDLHYPAGFLHKAQALAAQAFGADRSFFLVNGSTAGVLAMLLASLADGDELILSRASHRAALGGLILSGAVPIYLEPGILPGFPVTGQIKSGQLAEALAAHPKAKGVFLTSPSYHGLAADLGALIALVAARGLPFLLDEAHGAHFAFHEDFPPPGMRCGADLAVQSAHKTLTSLTQSSLLHWRQGHLELPRLVSALRILQSSSPSFLLLASLDATRLQMVAQGHELWGAALALASHVREEIRNRFAPIRCLEPKEVSAQGWELDPTRLLIEVQGLGVTGFEASDRLSRMGIQVEMADPFCVLALISLGDTEESVEALLGALRQLREDCAGLPPMPQLELFPPPLPQMVMSPREAFFLPSISQPLRQAIGRVAAETVLFSPPGLPLVAPGEEIDAQVVDYALQWRDYGAHLLGAEDEELKWIRVIR